jgi:hypothetical protein
MGERGMNRPRNGWPSRIPLYAALLGSAPVSGHLNVRKATDSLMALAESGPRRRRPLPSDRGPGQRRSNQRDRRGVIVGALITALFIGLVAYSQASRSATPSSASRVAAVLTADQVGNANGATIPSTSGEPSSLSLAPATSSPRPASASVVDEPALKPHEVFAFAPYWTLAQNAGFDLKGLSTLAYFSVGVNPNGTLDETGSGWAGYQSQSLVDLISRAHAAGDRVVLAVDDFGQSSLDELTSLPTAPATLGSALVQAIEAKDLDGVNLDFEGEGSADQVGLTNLVRQVSAMVHDANPHYQVTMDTYASSAADASGFYNLPALASSVDGFFVMAYQLNLAASPSGTASSMTRAMYANQTSAQQYAAAVAPGKVILGLPFYGYDWPTTNGTLEAAPMGAPSIITSGQAMTSGHALYWDSVTDTAWSSYQVNGQWYESFFEDPNSLYRAAQLAQSYKLAGVGIWTLGWDSDDTAMVSALDGHAPAEKDTLAGPTSTSPSIVAEATNSSPVGSTPAGAGFAPTTLPSPAPTTVPATTAPTAPSDGNAPPRNFSYSGRWDGADVVLRPASRAMTDAAVDLGELTGFATDDPGARCLSSESGLTVWRDSSSGENLFVVAEQPGDCATRTFVFTNPDPVATTATSTGNSG